jgi:hypothetical protein
VFAEYDQDQVQVGCKAGRLAAFIGAGVPVRESWDSPADWEGEGEPPRVGKKFYLIERACNMNRPEGAGWGDKTPQEEWVAKARREVQITTRVVVYAPQDTPLQAIVATVQSAAATAPKPSVSVVLAGTAPTMGQTIRVLNAAAPRVEWVVVKAGEAGVARGPASDLVADTLRPSDAQYYLVVDAGLAVPPNLLANLDAAVNDKAEQILALIPDEAVPGVGPLVSVRLHQHVGGNAPAYHQTPNGVDVRCDSVVEKISLLVPQTGGLVRTVGEFCLPG